MGSPAEQPITDRTGADYLLHAKPKILPEPFKTALSKPDEDERLLELIRISRRANGASVVRGLAQEAIWQLLATDSPTATGDAVFTE